MTRRLWGVFLIGIIASSATSASLFRSQDAHLVSAAEVEKRDLNRDKDTSPSLAEARTRARLLHETIRGALQVMHRDLFQEDESFKIPSQSLEDVFGELARSHDIDVRWLAVNTEAMNVDHKPKTDFEKQAAKALASGKQEFEANDAGTYHYAGAIRLSSQCLKCHVPRRTSNEARAAGLVISMPLTNR